MKGSECQLKLHSKDNEKHSRVSKWSEAPSEMVSDGSGVKINAESQEEG